MKVQKLPTTVATYLHIGHSFRHREKCIEKLPSTLLQVDQFPSIHLTSMHIKLRSTTKAITPVCDKRIH